MKIEYVRKSQYNPIELNSRPTTNAILQEFRKEKKEMEEKKKKELYKMLPKVSLKELK